MKADISEMAALYEAGGITLEEIGREYGVSKQAVSQRFAELEIRRPTLPPKCARIGKTKLDDLYTTKRFSIAKISGLLGTESYRIYQALRYYRIPKRRSIVFDGKYKDKLKKLEIGEAAEIDFHGKKPHADLHRAGKNAGVKVSVKKLAETKFLVTRRG